MSLKLYCGMPRNQKYEFVYFSIQYLYIRTSFKMWVKSILRIKQKLKISMKLQRQTLKQIISIKKDFEKKDFHHKLFFFKVYPTLLHPIH